MIFNDVNQELNVALKFKADDIEYVIFASTDVMRCFHCKKEGHIVKNCPEKGGNAGEENEGEQGEREEAGQPEERGAESGSVVSETLAKEGSKEQDTVQASGSLNRDSNAEESISPAIGRDTGDKGHLFKIENLTDLPLSSVKGHTLYELCVKLRHEKQLQGLPDTSWRERLEVEEQVRPAWRSFYNPPPPLLSKRLGDLQWRLLHTILAVNAYLCILDPTVSDKCPF
ncbi:uncharacterized protein LOC131737784 [Acipenser ruthenus]|uniref:uncharacterized protein LOC131737784 n=1 Tax=Acipenser ruthenus TaxID=7906 RepID=UPI00145B187F|nr:uncharacterized protein LOC131737784 [Acipenser ruthenus]